VDSEGDVSGSRAGAARCCEGGGGWFGRPRRTKNNQIPKERINPRRVLEILIFSLKNLDFSLDNLIFSLKNVKISWDQLTETHFYSLGKLENMKNFLKNRQNS
jgi:hypothetical protein